ncbi:MAG TPA: TonB-dependent siderophore receptor [Steroidobacteraceae bacterium]|nr:TonB-dependent siderophore receptor [Steroidobacteraceae bacterium]
MLLLTDLPRSARSRSPLAAAISVVLGAASPSIVYAQDAAAGDSSAVLAAAAPEGQSSERTSRTARRRGQALEEVTVEGQKYRSEVSSPKYTAELVDLPQTVVVIPKTVFREQAAITLSDVLRNTPGITLLAGEGGGASNTAGDSFFMRGFDATNSIFIDGVRDQAAYSRDVFNLDQVEVSKGPSGSYTGRGNASGSVNLVTKTPNDQPLRLMGLSYGSNDHVRSTVDFNQPLSETFLGGTAVRLNAMWQDGGVAGRDEVQHDAWGIAPSLAIGLGADTRLALAAQILRQESTPDYGLPSAALPGLNPTTPPVGHVDQTNFYGIAGVDFDDIDSDSYTARVEHDFAPGVTLRNLSRYSDNHRMAVVTTIQNPAAFDPVTGLVTRARQINERINRNFTNQTNLNFGFQTGGLEHSMSTGVEYANETQISPGRTGAGTAPPADIYHPNPHDPVTGFAPARTGAFTRGETETFAAYGFDTIELSRQWQLSLGARVERYDTDFLSVAIPGSGTPDIRLSVSDTLTSWNGGLVFKPADNGSIYVSAATTQTPPGGLNFTLSPTTSNANNPALEPQESTNYELGTKWDLLEGRLSTTAAVFHTVNTNVVTSETIGGTVVAVSFDSEQQVQGIELSVSGLLTPQWQVFAGYAYLDSEFSKSVTPNQQDATLQWTPRNSGNLWTTYQLPLGFSIGGGARFMDTVARSSLTVPNGAGGFAPSYWVYSATAAWQANEKVTLRLNVNNVTDEVYALSLNNNGGRYNPGAERSFLFSADFAF